MIGRRLIATGGGGRRMKWNDLKFFPWKQDPHNDSTLSWASLENPFFYSTTLNWLYCFWICKTHVRGSALHFFYFTLFVDSQKTGLATNIRTYVILPSVNPARCTQILCLMFEPSMKTSSRTDSRGSHLRTPHFSSSAIKTPRRRLFTLGLTQLLCLYYFFHCANLHRFESISSMQPSSVSHWWITCNV